MKKCYSVGLDVHRKSWVVSIVRDRELLARSRIAPSIDVLLTFFKAHSLTPENCHFAYEVGPTGYSLYDELTSRGFIGIVVSPAHVPSAPATCVKTDLRDSLELALKLESGILRGILVPSREERAIRDLSRTRWQLYRHRTSLIRQIKAKLLFLGIRYPDQQWSKKFQQFVLALEMHSSHKAAIERLIAVLEHVERELLGIDQDLRRALAAGGLATQIALIATIPGIGFRTAEVITTEVRDVSRFKGANALASYLGLTPVEHSSGAAVRRGSISRRGNPRVRMTLIEAAWTTVRLDPGFRAKYKRLVVRLGPRRAIVAVARKIVTVIYHMLKTGEIYRLEQSTA